MPVNRVKLLFLFVVMGILLLALPACSSFKIVKEWEVEGIYQPYNIWPVAAGKIKEDNYLFARMGYRQPEASGGVLVIDVQKPINPKQITYLQGPGKNILFQELSISNNLLFESLTTFLWIVDVSNPATPIELSRLSSIKAYNVAVSGHYLYVNNAGNIVTLDISNPSAPVIIASWHSGTWPDKMITSGSLLIVLGSDGSIHIIDISSPSDLKEISSFVYPGYRPPVNVSGHGIPGPYNQFHDIALAGQYLFIASEVDGLREYDISTPFQPHEIANYKEKELFAEKVIISEDHAYVYSENGSKVNIFAIDISDPFHLRVTGSLKLPQDISNLTSHVSYVNFVKIDNYIYFSAYAHEDKPVIEIINASAFHHSQK